MGGTDYDPIEGDPADDFKTVEEKLGRKNCLGLDDKQKKFLMRDIAAANNWQVPPGQEPAQPITGADWKKIIAAMEKKYPGWKYVGAGPASCCCCVP
jgi:hypothetical protein